MNEARLTLELSRDGATPKSSSKNSRLHLNRHSPSIHARSTHLTPTVCFFNQAILEHPPPTEQFHQPPPDPPDTDAHATAPELPSLVDTMGLFSSFQSEEAKRAEEVRTGAVAPDRSERRKCWEARDAYFGCLDRNVIVDALKDDAKARKACPAENQVFERDCAAAWVKYFKQWRVADLQKKQRIAQLEAENAIKMDVTTTFADQPSASSSSSKGPTPTKVDLQDMLASRRQ
ncbi:hypothetical protein CaCOL14_012328 [Colletotrichum acutatum]